MFWWRKKRPRPSRESIEAKLDQLAATGKSDPPISDEEVTGILEGALARLRKADASSRTIFTVKIQELIECELPDSIPPKP